jgi:hypothetical protein
MESFFEANEIYNLLTSNKDMDLAPTLLTYNGKPGMMQIFYDAIPMGAGKNIHDQINYKLVKECPSFRQNTVYFQEIKQNFQDTSDTAKLGRAKMNKTWSQSSDREPTAPPGTSSYMNRNNYNKSDNNSNDNNNRNSNNTNNSQIIPYHNPHNGRLSNINDWIETDRNTDLSTSTNTDDGDDFELYDIEEVFGNRNESIEELNPAINVTNNLSNINRNNLDLPCSSELVGKCQAGKSCKYSHDFKILQAAWKSRTEELKFSRYKVTPGPSGPYTPVNPPQIMRRDAPLRSMSIIEEGQVRNTPTNNYNDNNRGKAISFSDLPAAEKQGSQSSNQSA